MTKPVFSAALIDDLKRRVISHNGVHQSKVKLGELKKIYERGFKGEAPAERAMRKVDEHLTGLAKAFNPDQPRDKDGKFTSGEGDQSAAGAAAEGVKRAAHHAAYIAGLADEPLKPGVKVPKRAPLGLPADRDVHRALQDQNAGYSAFSSDVIPEFRGELLGSFARPAIAVAGGAVLAHAVVSNNPRNLARRAATKVPAYAAGKTARLAVAIGTAPMAFAARKAHEILGVQADAAAVKARGDAIGKMTDKQVHDVVRHVMNAGFSGAHVVARPVHNFIVGPAPKLKPEEIIPKGAKLSIPVARRAAVNGARLFGRGALRGFRRSLAAGAAVALPAYVIDQAITGSTVDPENIGAAYDKYSYRIVRKVMDMPELDAMQKVLTTDLRKAAFGEELNSGIENLLPKITRAGVSALGSLAGAGAGAATGAAGQAVANALNKPKGNPYHDKDGKFTSKDEAAGGGGVARAAAIGAGIGAALGGGGTHMRLSGYNRGLFRTAMERLDNHVMSLASEATVIPSRSTIPEISKLESEHFEALNTHKNSEPAFVKAAMDADPQYQAVLSSVSRYGKNDPHYFVQKIHDQINKHIADLVGDRKFAARVKDMKPEQFAEAIKDLPAARRDVLLEKFKQREEAQPTVAAALKAHQALIDETTKDVAAKEAAADAAGKVKEDAKFDMDSHVVEGADKEAATKAYDAAIKAHRSAIKAHETAAQKLDELRKTGVEVRSPLDKSVVPPPSDLDLNGIKQEAERAARDRAKTAFVKKGDKLEKEYDEKIAKARAAYLSDLKIFHHSKIAEFVHYGRRAGALPRVTGAAVEPLLKAKADHDVSLAKLTAAERAVAEAKGFQEKAKKGEAKAAARAVTAQAQAHLTAVEAEHAKTQAALMKQAGAFMARYQAFRDEAKKSRTYAMLTPELRAQMMADFRRGLKVGYDPIGHYAVEPTAKRLKGVLDYVKPRAAGAGRYAKAVGKKSFHAAFLRDYDIPQADGTTIKQPGPDPVKIGFVLATGAGAEALNYLRQTRDYARERIKGNKNARLPTNLKVEVRRHATKSNEGLFAIHAADPRNKGERIVLFGHRYEEGKDQPIDLNPGARLSDVLNNLNNKEKGGQPNRDAGWLDGKVKNEIDQSIGKIPKEKKLEISGGGVKLSARHPSETEQNNAAGNYMSAFRNKFVDKKSHTDAGALYKGLDELFSNKQSAILKPAQYYQILTGYKPNEGKKGDGLFGDNSDFGSNDAGEAQGALESTVKKIMDKMAPSNESAKANLKRAVAVIGYVKKIPPDELKPVYEQIGGGAAETETPEENAYTSASFSMGGDFPEESPRTEKSGGEFDDQAERAAKSLAPKLGVSGDAENELLQETIKQFARAVDAKHEYGPAVSTMIVKRAFESMGSDKAGAASLKRALKSHDPKPFIHAINVEAQKHRDAEDFSKADFVVTAGALDDFEALAKRASLAARAVDPTLQTAGDASTQAPKYTGADAVAAAADVAGAGLSNHILNRALKTPEIKPGNIVSGTKEFFSGGAGNIAGNVAKAGVKGLAASAVGAGLYNVASSVLGGSQYRRNTSPQESLALGGGNIAGGIAGGVAGEAAGAAIGSVVPVVGTAVGAGVGEFAGQAAGSALGEFLGHTAFQKYFSGYNPKAVGRIMKTNVKPPAPGQEEAAQAGEVGGGVIGNTIGGELGEGFGSVLGAATGIKAAQATSPNPSSLSGRPKAGAIA